MMLDDSGIERILGKIGQVVVPETLDRNELQRDILAALDFYQGYLRNSQKGRRTERRKAAKEIGECADRLRQLLTENTTMIRSRLRAGLFPVLLRALQQLRSAATNAERSQADVSSIREVLELSPLM